MNRKNPMFCKGKLLSLTPRYLQALLYAYLGTSNLVASYSMSLQIDFSLLSLWVWTRKHKWTMLSTPHHTIANSNYFSCFLLLFFFYLEMYLITNFVHIYHQIFFSHGCLATWNIVDMWGSLVNIFHMHTRQTLRVETSHVDNWNTCRLLRHFVIEELYEDSFPQAGLARN